MTERLITHRFCHPPKSSPEAVSVTSARNYANLPLGDHACARKLVPRPAARPSGEHRRHRVVVRRGAAETHRQHHAASSCFVGYLLVSVQASPPTSPC